MDNVLGTPFNLTASNITASSISLRWAMNTSFNQIRGYRVFYKHNSYEDIKTIEGPDPAYKLTGLSPYTMYEVRIMPIGVEGTDKGQTSEKIFKTTDTAPPSAPFISNVTCYETQKIYIEWKRPLTYYKNVDYYYIYYKKALESSYEKNVQIQANSEYDQRFLLDKEDVDVANEYCIQISAGTKSTKSSAVYKGEFSDEMCVELPQNGCIPTF